MSSPKDGILEAGRWDEKLDGEGWAPYWRPVAAGPNKGRRALSRLGSWLWPGSSSVPAKKMHPTAYLDGLRGFAALLVYFHHHQLWAHDTISGQFQYAFGYEDHYRLAAFPIVRTFFTGGHYAVSTFFVISGYVLSLKPLTLIYAGNRLGLADHLASALFRRWIRLYLPLFATVFIYGVSWHVFGIWVRGSPQQGNLRDELWVMYTQTKNFSFVFNTGGDPFLRYNNHLWSIPIEFKGSLVIYTTVLALSRASTTAFLWCEVGLIFYFMYIADGWYCSMFLAGMLICHLDRLSADGELPSFLKRLAPYKTFIYYHLFIVSLYLGGVPSENNNIEIITNARGWHYLAFLKPQAVFDFKWFYLFWAAVLLVAAVPRIGWLKRFFETRMCQYLGRISFSFYLVHGPILNVIGDRIYMAVGLASPLSVDKIPWWHNKMPLPMNGPMGLEISFLVPHIILLPLTLAVAEMSTRLIDTPSVRFAAWMYRTVSAESRDKSPSPKLVSD